MDVGIDAARIVLDSNVGLDYINHLAGHIAGKVVDDTGVKDQEGSDDIKKSWTTADQTP